MEHVLTGSVPRVLLTGAAGFTARHLAPCLRGAGYEVHRLVRRSPPSSSLDAQALHLGDLQDAAGTVVLVDRIRPEWVVHLAGIAFLPYDGPETFYTTHILGTRNLLDALVATRAPVHGILLASSSAVYGRGLSGPIDEEAPTRPASDYGVSKLAMENMARLFMDRLPITIARPFNYTGVGQSINYVIPKIVEHFRNGARHIDMGNLAVARDFSDVRDVVCVYRRLLEAPAAVGEVVNVCSGTVSTLAEILGLAKALTGRQIDVRADPALMRPYEVTWSQGDRNKLDSLIGAFPRRGLCETLRWMLDA